MVGLALFSSEARVSIFLLLVDLLREGLSSARQHTWCNCELAILDGDCLDRILCYVYSVNLCS